MPAALSEYRRAHSLVAEVKGPARHKPCDFCGKFADDWAYNHADPREIYRDGYLWSENTSYYFPLCRKHHRAYDRTFRTKGREALTAFAEKMRRENQRLPEEISVMRAMCDALWRSREIGLGNIEPGV